MAEPTLFTDKDDRRKGPDGECLCRNCGYTARDVGDRIEIDRLYENSLQKRIIEKLRADDTGGCDR